MRRVLVLFAAFAAVLALASPAQAAEQFKSELLGANEVGGGDPDGHGMARVIVRQDGAVCFDLAVTGVAPILAGHIHEGAVGVNGGVVVDLDIAGNGLSGCVVADTAVLAAIRANPSGYYFNLHNADYPAGALRGQVG